MIDIKYNTALPVCELWFRNDLKKLFQEKRSSFIDKANSIMFPNPMDSSHKRIIIKVRSEKEDILIQECFDSVCDYYFIEDTMWRLFKAQCKSSL